MWQGVATWARGDEDRRMGSTRTSLTRRRASLLTAVCNHMYMYLPSRSRNRRRGAGASWKPLRNGAMKLLSTRLAGSGELEDWREV